MKIFTYLIISSFLFFSCSKQENQKTRLIANFGEQPSIGINSNGDVAAVFAKKDSIFYAISTDEGKSFSNPTLIAELHDLALGYSSGPEIVFTSNATFVTAVDRAGNLFIWKLLNNDDSWSEPVQINDIKNSVGETLTDITSTLNGNLFVIWIDTRVLPDERIKESKISKNKMSHNKTNQKVEEDLSIMTPIGITKEAMYKKIGDVPPNAILAFHDDSKGNLLWVLLDENHKALKAENIEAYQKFQERNSGMVKTKGKIYLSSSSDGGKTWFKSKIIYRSPDGSVCKCCKPSIISDAQGNLTVMFRNNINGYRDLYFTKSIDGGASFTKAEKLGSGGWKINGCPMDGGDLTVNKKGELKTIWQRNGEIFSSNSSINEQKIANGKSPSIAVNDNNTYIVFSKNNDIITISSDNSSETIIGSGNSPKVVALEHGAIYYWTNYQGINYKKVL